MVSPQSENPLISIWLGRLGLFQFVLAAMFLVGSKKDSGNDSTDKTSQTRLMWIGGATVILALAGNVVFGDLLHHGAGVSMAVAPNVGKFRTGTLQDLDAAKAEPAILLIDARMEQDYQAGTIERAINIPVTASTWDIRTYLKELNLETPIVVFCQSASCRFDEQIASQLIGLGFRNVTVCDEGYAEYTAQAVVSTNKAKE